MWKKKYIDNKFLCFFLFLNKIYIHTNSVQVSNFMIDIDMKRKANITSFSVFIYGKITSFGVWGTLGK
jgi:hypothetical protein